MTKPSVVSKEKNNLSTVLVSNGYLYSVVKNITETKGPTARTEPVTEPKSTVVLPYIKGVSEALCCCWQQQGVRTVFVVFKSDTTLRSHLVRPKDSVDPNKARWDWSSVYKIPCECGKVY